MLKATQVAKWKISDGWPDSKSDSIYNGYKLILEGNINIVVRWRTEFCTWCSCL